MNITSEKRPTTANSTNKVKWRDDFEHYDNDSKPKISSNQIEFSLFLASNNHKNPSPTTNHLPSNSKLPSSPRQTRSSKRKPCSNNNTQPKTSLTTKGNKIKLPQLAFCQHPE